MDHWLDLEPFPLPWLPDLDFRLSSLLTGRQGTSEGSFVCVPGCTFQHRRLLSEWSPADCFGSMDPAWAADSGAANAPNSRQGLACFRVWWCAKVGRCRINYLTAYNVKAIGTALASRGGSHVLQGLHHQTPSWHHCRHCPRLYHPSELSQLRRTSGEIQEAGVASRPLYPIVVEACLPSRTASGWLQGALRVR